MPRHPRGAAGARAAQVSAGVLGRTAEEEEEAHHHRSAPLDDDGGVGGMGGVAGMGDDHHVHDGLGADGSPVVASAPLSGGDGVAAVAPSMEPSSIPSGDHDHGGAAGVPTAAGVGGVDGAGNPMEYQVTVEVPVSHGMPDPSRSPLVYNARDVAPTIVSELDGSTSTRFPCPHPGCTVTFGQRSTLFSHMRIHTGERPFVCDHPGCGATFNQKGNLTNHKLVHTGIRRYICTQSGCGKAFLLKHHLVNHIRSHTGDKPFLCPLCHKRWSDASARRRHMQSQHPDYRQKLPPMEKVVIPPHFNLDPIPEATAMMMAAQAQQAEAANGAEGPAGVGDGVMDAVRDPSDGGDSGSGMPGTPGSLPSPRDGSSNRSSGGAGPGLPMPASLPKLSGSRRSGPTKSMAI